MREAGSEQKGERLSDLLKLLQTAFAKVGVGSTELELLPGLRASDQERSGEWKRETQLKLSWAFCFC